MTIGKRLLTYVKSRLPLLVLIAYAVSCAVAGAVYAKYVRDVDSDVGMQIVGEGDVELEVVDNGDGSYRIKHAEGSKIPAYVRFTVVVNWMDDEGNLFYTSPTQYSVTAENCTTHSDGYRYYNGVVAKDGGISVTVALNGGVTAPTGYPELDVQILAEAIQCVPSTAVGEAWGVVFENGAWTAP